MKNKEEDNIEKKIENNLDIKDNCIKNDEKNYNTSDLIKLNLLNFLNLQWQEYALKVEEEKINFQKQKTQLKNRSEKDIDKNRKFCLEKIILSFLPTIDNIERALDLLKTKKEEEKYILIIKKLNFILILFQNIFREYSIKKINDTNVLFNPSIHQAVSVQYNNEIPSNQVITIMQSGYIFHNTRLLRPAMVVVSQKKC
ncbi:nucleotide exchange factor GrpE [Buchnera aphidicola]|uniref:nucleotide exchange factor GrpE n=1 Tax=Buchnera aphidicola TaxID=9 RepID=UPI003463E769